MNGWTYVKYGFSSLTSLSKAIWSRRRSRVDGDNDDYAHLLDFVHERVVAHFVVVHCTLFFMILLNKQQTLVVNLCFTRDET